MSNHQKRLSVPKSWPVERKTETFTVKAEGGPHGEAGVPLVILLRDVLGYVDSRKEARYALEQDSVLLNGDAIGDEQLPVGMFDILAFVERGEYYRVFPDEGGRLSLTPIDEDAAQSKLGKLVNKTQVGGGDTQLTMHDGRNVVVEDAGAYDTNDSLVVGNDDNEIVAHFPYEEGALVTAVRGGHAGDVGEIVDIEVTTGSSANAVTVEREDGSTFETIEEYVVVIDENFTSDSQSESDTSSGDSRETEDDGDDADSEDDAEVSDDE